MFIRDQAVGWCNEAFCEAASQLKPMYLKYGIENQLDWFAVWRGL